MEWSPDGRWLLFRSPVDGVNGTWRTPAEGGGEPVLLVEGGGYSRWSPGGDEIFFIAVSEARLMSLSLESDTERTVASLEGKPGSLSEGEDALATDGN